jgi:hypothetical protein
VLAGAGLLTDVELLASGELFATSEVFARDELPQADSARVMIAVPSGVASNASPPFVRDVCLCLESFRLANFPSALIDEGKAPN